MMDWNNDEAVMSFENMGNMKNYCNIRLVCHSLKTDVDELLGITFSISKG